MKKGISLVALVITIIVLIILTAAVIWSGAAVPEETKLAVFYNDMATLQDAVTLRMLTNVLNMESKEWGITTQDEEGIYTTKSIADASKVETQYSKYAGLIDTKYFNWNTEAKVEGEGESKVITSAGDLIASAKDKYVKTYEITNGSVSTVDIYPLLPTAADLLQVSMSSSEIVNYGIDAEGKVYYIPGVWLHPDENEDVYVTRELIVAKTSITTAAATNIRNY